MRCVLMLAFVGVTLTTPVYGGPILNGSFETGLAGWNVSIDTYNSNRWGDGYPAGTVGLRDAFIDGLYPGGFGLIHTPDDGASMAVIGSQDAGGSAVGDEEPRPWNVAVRQVVTLNSGELLNGSAFFYNGDWIPQDSAWVRIYNMAGDLMATPWSFESGNSDGFEYRMATPWQRWAWQASTSDSYILALGVTTLGDNSFDSYAGFDGVRVPEPATWMLLSLGAIGLTRRRR